MATTNRRKPTAEEIQALRARIAGLSHEEKVQLAARTKPILEHRGQSKAKKHDVPKNDNELHGWVWRETGFNIPRVAVCEDHCAPFDPIADGFFNRASQILIMKSREAGGTLNVSILQYAKCALVPKNEGVTFGAIEAQARRAFQYVQDFIHEEIDNPDGTVTRQVKSEIEGEPLRSMMRWKIGSSLSIIIGTKSGVNSPHPNVVHADELDLMDPEVFSESRNMSSSTLLPDGTRIPAQDIVTSTRKSMHGLMQMLINEIDEAIEAGYEPPWKLYAYCVFEIAEEVPNCRRAPEDQRRARLEELGRDPCELCSCDKVVKGEWSEDNPRTLESVCAGKFFRSRGWMSYEDIKRKFRNNSQVVWEAQMECRRPMADGLYLPGWTRQRFTVIGWVPDPRFGNIWTSTDWGGSAESAVLWAQGPLRMPVTVQGSQGQVEIPKGAYVVFDELLAADTGATRLADMVISKELGWRRKVPNFRVTGRFCDMAGKQQRDDWREHNPPLRTVSYLPNRDFDPTVKNLQDLVGDKRYWVDTQCSRHMDDIESWRQKDGREVHDESSHTMAASRYLHANSEALERRKQHRNPSDSAKPVVVQRAQQHTGVAVSVAGRSSIDTFASERGWRGQLGETFPHR